jgi:hypothetical protein
MRQTIGLATGKGSTQPAGLSPKSNAGPAHPILSLQRSVGNRAVQSLLAATPVQRDDDGWLGSIGSALSDAGSAVVSGVGSAIDTGADLAASAGSAIASGAKTAASDVSDVAGGIYGAMKDASAGVKEGEGAVDSGIDWLEGKAKSGTGWLADEAKGIPGLEQVADAGKSFVDTSVDVTGGALKGATGLLGGVVGAVADPVDTAKGLYTMSSHIPVMGMPQKMLSGAYDLAFSDKSLGDVAKETLDPMEDAKYWGKVGGALLDPYAQSIKEGKPGEALGRGVVDIGSLFLGAGEAGAAGKAGELAKVADLGDLGKGAEMADASKMAEGANAAKAASTGSTLGRAWDWVKGVFGGAEDTKKPPLSDVDQAADEYLKEMQKKGLAPPDEELNPIENVPQQPGGGYGKPGPGNWKPNMDPDSLWKRRRKW